MKLTENLRHVIRGNDNKAFEDSKTFSDYIHLSASIAHPDGTVGTTASTLSCTKPLPRPQSRRRVLFQTRLLSYGSEYRQQRRGPALFSWVVRWGNLVSWLLASSTPSREKLKLSIVALFVFCITIYNPIANSNSASLLLRRSFAAIRYNKKKIFLYENKRNTCSHSIFFSPF